MAGSSAGRFGFSVAFWNDFYVVEHTSDGDKGTKRPMVVAARTILITVELNPYVEL